MRMKKTKTKKPSKPLDMRLEAYMLSSPSKEKKNTMLMAKKGRPKK